MGAAVKRLAAHERRWLTGNPELQQNLAVERYLAHEMTGVVGQEHGVIGRHMDAVRPRILALAPGAQEIALAVEHHDRVLASVENIDIVLGVDADRPDLFE